MKSGSTWVLVVDPCAAWFYSTLDEFVHVFPFSNCLVIKKAKHMLYTLLKNQRSINPGLKIVLNQSTVVLFSQVVKLINVKKSFQYSL